MSGSGELPSVPNEEGEGEHIFVFLNQRGQDLVNGVVPPIENTLRDVTLAAEAEATLVMVNKNLDRRVELITVTLVNPELYQLLNPAERCTARFDLTRGRSRLCNIQIRRRNETRRAQNSRIQITYRYPVEKLAGRLTYRQEFNIVAS